MVDENALLRARIEAAKVAATVASGTRDGSITIFVEVFKYTKKEFEEALRLVEKAPTITFDGKKYIYID